MAFLRELFPKSSDAQKRADYSDKAKSPGIGHAAQTAVQAGFPLAMAQAGELQHVTSIRGKDEVRRFLGSLGFAEGAEVTLISEMNGNVIVNVKGTRIAVSKAMAMRVYVA